MLKKRKNNFLLIISILVIVIIVLLIVFFLIFIPPKNNLCEKEGYSCFESTCPPGYAEVDLGGCYNQEVCCDLIQSGECTQKGESRGVGDPECCEGLKEVTGALIGQPANSMRSCVDCGNGICEEHENWHNCPEDCKKSIIYGFVSLKQGNCMPPVGPDCIENPLNTEIAIFPKVNINDLNGNYYQTITGPIQIINSNIRINGYYEIELQPGEYSIFAKDPETNEYYCNSFGNEYACHINLGEKSENFDIIIDHAFY